MFQGTGSDVGKSLVVAGLCRAFTNRGLKVLPFKPQNMSNNAAVTADGGEIGRAQALQARACRASASVHMNPVLLKPQSDVGSQVVVQGKVIGNAGAKDYQSWKPRLMASVLDSYNFLKSQADLILIEGAGSASEVNLRANDIANMGFARAANVPVVVIGDIDRGGVIAQIVGTKAVIAPDDAAMIKGFIVNRFRGDPRLFEDGMQLIAAKSGWPALGLVPFFVGASKLPAEDAVALEKVSKTGQGTLMIIVPKLKHISNFDDFDPLKHEPSISLIFVPPGQPFPIADLIILPGSKTTIADLAHFRAQGWDIDLAAHVRRGGKVLGVCGGYQMLGQAVHDPQNIEGDLAFITGLGHLDVETTLTRSKTLREVSGLSTDNTPFKGYEMHVGITSGPDCARPLLRFDGRGDGAISPCGNIRACYVHGLFTDDAQRSAWLNWIGGAPSVLNYEAEIDATLDSLAAHLEANLDLDKMLRLADGISS